MTRQEPHTCDVCGVIFYVPQDELRTLEINRGSRSRDELIYDMCFDCWEKLLKSIWDLREKKEQEM